MKPPVAISRVIHEPDGVFKSVSKTMQLANWEDWIKGKKIFLKINAVSHLNVPGQNTSPWVLEALIRFFQENMESVELYFGDGNTSGRRSFHQAVKRWEYDSIADKYKVNLVDLSKEKYVSYNFGARALRKIWLPKILVESDVLVSVPVMKTHIEGTLSCSLKNLFGCIPAPRHHLHINLNEAIADIAEAINPPFTVIDATVGIEAGGPIVGKPKVADTIIASGDLVAADAVSCRLMDIDANSVGYLMECEKRGLGEIGGYVIRGDKIPIIPFEQGEVNKFNQWERAIRKTSFGNLIYKTWLSKPLSWYSTFLLNRWYRKEGKKLRDKFVETCWYGGQF